MASPQNLRFSFQFDVDNERPVGVTNVKFCKDQKHACKFCIKYFLHVNTYKHGDDANILRLYMTQYGQHQYYWKLCTLMDH